MHDDLPVVDVIVVCADGTSCGWLVVDVGQFLHMLLAVCSGTRMAIAIAHLEDPLVLSHDGQRGFDSVERGGKGNSVLRARRVF